MIRTALLIGVTRTPDASDFTSLDRPVVTDLERLGKALESSGYDVTVLRDPGRGRIGVEIAKIAAAVPEGGTLLLYFTGHGVRLRDTDYLVPVDALAPPDGVWEPEYEDSLLPLDISRYLGKCRAGTLLWLVDACRDVRTGTAFGTRITHGPPSGRFAMMVGCDLDELCGYSDEGSFFSRGLAEAFSAMTTPQTVHEVYEAARSFTSRLAGQHGQRQHVRIYCPTDSAEETRVEQVCEGRQLMDEWRAVVTDDRLWRLASRPDLHPRLQDCLLTLVEDCARLVQNADQRLRNPWADDDFAPRLALRTLPLVIPEEVILSPVEVAALIAAVFLREGAWADRLSQASEVSPLVVGHEADAGPLRRHLEQVHDQHGQLSRKVTESLVKGRYDDCQDIGLWLVHRWIAERFETDAKVIPAGLVTGLAKNLLGTSDTGRVDEFACALSRLAASIGTDPPVDGSPDSTSRHVQVPGGPQQFRERPLAALLRVAGALAVDVRTLPDVVSEHLGGSDPLSPGEAVAVVRGSVHWSSGGAELHMDALCPHQAMHAALEEAVETSDRRATQIRALAQELPESEAVLLARIPTRVTASGLRPKQLGARKAYDVPLLRFRLAQTEVRDLLMGRQLYGSPDLALRELYQNAMDACRYRAMRWEYLRGKDERPAEWHGRIDVVQGADKRGRYVECRDNGVGMGLEQLTNTFTQAGSRFEQSRTFRQEQAAWLRHDPALRLYPNSRFGIGVFSYFMLADEMTIITRQVSREGIPAQDALRVEISSSGSLFRILKHDEPGDNLAEGGTLVRLYLRGDGDLADLSCTKTLMSLVAVSEFHLEASDSSAVVVWEPGVLYPLRAHKGKTPQVAVPGVLWWVDGEGVILCDGIVTDQKPFGYVLNLSGAHSGTLSVNRKELQRYDRGWAERNWVEGVRALLEWQGLTMNWLWEMDVKSLRVLRVLWPELRDGGKKIGLGEGGSCDLGVTGVFFADSEVMGTPSLHQDDEGVEAHVRVWRATVLDLPRPQARSTAPRSLAGFPLARPGDTSVYKKRSTAAYALDLHASMRSLQEWTTAVGRAFDLSMTVGEVFAVLRRLRIVHPRLAPPRVVIGNLDWCPDAMEESISKELQGVESRRMMVGRADLRGLVAASLRMRCSFEELIEWCARFAPMRLVALPQVPEHHRKHICSTEDMSMLYAEKSTDYTRLSNAVTHPEDVREVVLKLDVQPEVVLQRLVEFSWLGWAAPSVDEVKGWLALDEVTFGIVRRFVNWERTLDWGATIMLAATFDVTLGEAESDLVEIAASLRLSYSCRLAGLSGAEGIVPDRSVAYLVGGIYQAGTSLVEGYSLEQIAIHMPKDVEVDEFSEVLGDLTGMGILVPSNIGLLAVWEDLPLRFKFAFSGNDPAWDENDFPTEPTASVLFVAAVNLGESLGDVWKLARREASRFGLNVPVLPKALVNIRPRHEEVEALVHRGDDYDGPPVKTPSWVALTMFGLARYAHRMTLSASEAYERLAVLRSLGAIVPELSSDALRALERTSPDERDLLALEGTHRVTEMDESLVALDLVSVAGRLGEPINETWQRFLPYLPFAPEPKVSVIPNVIPCWQDFAILSRYLDGLLPAVAGKVDPAHVAFVAAQVGESEQWVWGRLKLYEGMFELDLSDMLEGT